MSRLKAVSQLSADRIMQNYAALAVKVALQAQALMAAREFIKSAVYEFKGDATAAVKVLKELDQILDKPRRGK